MNWIQRIEILYHYIRFVTNYVNDVKVQLNN